MSDEFRKYFDMAGNYTSNPHFQDFPAIQELMKKGSIQKDAVVVPGHSADLLAGKWLPVEINEGNADSLLRENLSDLIFNIHFGLNDKRDAKQIKESISQKLKQDKFSKVEDYVKYYDEWNIMERQAKFTVNSLRVFDFFELRWAMPLWDNDFTHFWHKVPLKYKIDKNLYHEFVMERYFKPQKVDFVRHLNLTETDAVLKIKKILPYWIARPLRALIHKLRSMVQEEHFNAFDEIYLLLYEHLRENGEVDYKKSMDINQVVAQYYLMSLKKNNRQ